MSDNNGHAFIDRPEPREQGNWTGEKGTKKNGILSYAVKLLSEKLWETQKLFRDEMKKSMQFLDSRDSGTDILFIALISLFGKDALGDQKDGVSPDMAGELSNLGERCLLQILERRVRLMAFTRQG